MASRQHNQRSKTLGNKYMLGDEIGRGKYGRVYKGLDLENGDFVAIKQVSLENIPQEILDTIMQEIDLLKNLNHKNIVKYLGSLKTNSHLHIILEYMQNGSLANIVKPNKFGPLPESLAAVYIAQVLEGLVYLHEQGVVHRDIKGSNIFTTNEGLVKLADFGEATKSIEAADVNTHSVVGTPYWMAPEVIEMSGVSAASDIWSVGCTVIELFTSSPPYYELQPMPALFRIVQDVHPPIPKEFSPEITDFLRQCLQKDAIQRPDAKTLLMHPWLQNSRRALLSVRQPDQPARDTTTGERLHSETMKPTSLTMRLLEKITNNFSNERLLGQGAYGKVYRGVRDGQEIAVKLLYNNVQTINDEQFIREFDNLMMLNHPNIVRLVGYCYETQRQHMEFEGRTVFGETTYKALCFEYMPKGSLQKHLSDECNGLNWQTRYKIIKGACEGLKYLHEGLKKPFYHLDLKPDNILLDENMVPKLADFGSSKLFGEEQTRTTQNLIGTIGYLPPEYLFGNLVSNKLDIFGLGVIMTKIIAGPSGHTRHAEMHYQKFLDQVQGNWRKRLQATWSFPELLEAQCQQVQRCTEIALSCMEMDRHKRPSIVDIIHELDKTEICIEKVIPWST